MTSKVSPDTKGPVDDSGKGALEGAMVSLDAVRGKSGDQLKVLGDDVGNSLVLPEENLNKLDVAS